MRRLVVGLVTFTLRIFFRRVEVAGAEQVPPRGPVIFCPNHPNALIDAALLLATAPRPVSFLAKAPLFRMPVVGWFARSLDAIPVYRRQDDSGDTARNAEMFAAARSLLERGGTIAIFPEGTSHSDPRLRPLRTGAARIALGAGTALPVTIVPVALTYFDKATFRSSALVSFGTPIPVVPGGALVDGEPPPADVAALMEAVGRGLRAVVLETDQREALALAQAVERLFQHTEGVELEASAEMRRNILDAYPAIVHAAPGRVAAIRRRLDRHEARLQAAGLDPRLLELRRFTLGGVLRYSLSALLYFVATLPFAVPGIVIHWPAYRLIGILARRASGGSEDVIATAKALSAMLLFPLTWIAVGGIAGSWLGWPLGVLAGAISPFLGWVGLRFTERFDATVGATRALILWGMGRERYLKLQVGRRMLRTEILALSGDVAARSESYGTGSSTG